MILRNDTVHSLIIYCHCFNIFCFQSISSAYYQSPIIILSLSSLSSFRTISECASSHDAEIEVHKVFVKHRPIMHGPLPWYLFIYAQFFSFFRFSVMISDSSHAGNPISLSAPALTEIPNWDVYCNFLFVQHASLTLWESPWRMLDSFASPSR
jgi:hypothetical protein